MTNQLDDEDRPADEDPADEDPDDGRFEAGRYYPPPVEATDTLSAIGPFAGVANARNLARASASGSPQARRRARILVAVLLSPVVVGVLSILVSVLRAL